MPDDNASVWVLHCQPVAVTSSTFVTIIMVWCELFVFFRLQTEDNFFFIIYLPLSSKILIIGVHTHMCGPTCWIEWICACLIYGAIVD